MVFPPLEPGTNRVKIAFENFLGQQKELTFKTASCRVTRFCFSGGLNPGKVRNDLGHLTDVVVGQVVIEGQQGGLTAGSFTG